jgi:hypothetical protein
VWDYGESVQAKMKKRQSAMFRMTRGEAEQMDVHGFGQK